MDERVDERVEAASGDIAFLLDEMPSMDEEEMENLLARHRKRILEDIRNDPEENGYLAAMLRLFVERVPFTPAQNLELLHRVIWLVWESIRGEEPEPVDAFGDPVPPDLAPGPYDGPTDP